MTSERVNYWDYIQVEELLSLQRGLEESDAALSSDEITFITVHQVFELWFKLILGEMRAARDLFTRDPVAEQELSGAVARLQRITTILRVAARHFDVVETITTRQYLGFRDKLMGASGFQSAQLRQIEILFGLMEAERVPLGPEGGYLEALMNPGGADSPASLRVRAALADRPNLREAINAWLARTPIDGVGAADPGADEHIDAFIERWLTVHGRMVDATCARAMELAETDEDRRRLAARYEREKDFARAFLNPTAQETEQAGEVGEITAAELRHVRAAMIFIETYSELPLLAWPREVLESLVEMEQAFVMFRQRHARMVERVIGRRVGTGGSSGVDYLDETALKYRIFRDLWTVRTLQLPRNAAPPIENAAFYGFRAGC
jgi:tryptophan 2,3-dioxygenase